MGDISWAVQQYAEAKGFSIVKEYVGHGIGRALHEEPSVPNFGTPGAPVVLQIQRDERLLYVAFTLEQPL